jgi:hypothetical protein
MNNNQNDADDIPFDVQVVWSVLNGPYVFPIEGGRQNFQPTTLEEVEARVPNPKRFREFYLREYLRRQN